ncbi:MAG: hypothetical protein U9M98_02550 [Patescibacteria group bacterium]|nr:hypothetical protein [Patescibacteria group bacterium]
MFSLLRNTGKQLKEAWNRFFLRFLSRARILVFAIEEYPEVQELVFELEKAGCVVDFCNRPAIVCGNVQKHCDLVVFFADGLDVAPLIGAYVDSNDAPRVAAVTAYESKISRLQAAGAHPVVLLTKD